MRTLDTALLRIGLVIGGFFAFLIAIEAGLLSARFRSEGVFFHWQLWLLAGISVATLRDHLASLRCDTCSQWKAPSLGGLIGMGRIICQTCRESRRLTDQAAGLPLNRSNERISL